MVKYHNDGVMSQKPERDRRFCISRRGSSMVRKQLVICSLIVLALILKSCPLPLGPSSEDLSEHTSDPAEGQPDLVPTYMWKNVPQIYVGESFTIYVTIENVGDGDASVPLH
jgi:hypothetical protein